MVDESENRLGVPEEARQPVHRQLYDRLAGFLTVFKKRRRSRRSMVSEPLAFLSPQPVNQVRHTRQYSTCDPTVCRYVRNRRTL